MMVVMSVGLLALAVVPPTLRGVPPARASVRMANKQQQQPTPRERLLEELAEYEATNQRRSFLTGLAASAATFGAGGFFLNTMKAKGVHAPLAAGRGRVASPSSAAGSKQQAATPLAAAGGAEVVAKEREPETLAAPPIGRSGKAADTPTPHAGAKDFRALAAGGAAALAAAASFAGSQLAGLGREKGAEEGREGAESLSALVEAPGTPSPAPLPAAPAPEHAPAPASTTEDNAAARGGDSEAEAAAAERALKAALLRAEGAAAVSARSARREADVALARAAAARRTLKASSLRQDGAAAVAEREEARAGAARALKASSLRREGAAAVAAREEAREALSRLALPPSGLRPEESRTGG